VGSDVVVVADVNDVDDDDDDDGDDSTLHSLIPAAVVVSTHTIS
jgi:hypothetical protein